jgi:hypothetical protein
VYVAQGEPDAAPDASFGSARRHLKLDLEQVQRVHAEHCDGARADAGKRVVLQTSESESAPKGPGCSLVLRTIAWVGKKLGSEYGLGVDMRNYDAFVKLGPHSLVVADDYVQLVE